MNMNRASFKVEEIRESDRKLISDFLTHQWGSHLSVSKGKLHNLVQLPGFICLEYSRIIGLVTYNIEEKDCEIVTLDSRKTSQGLGTQLINKVMEKARKSGCRRVWLITTNDNTRAIGFYQKRGFEWVGFYKDAMVEARKLKPEIPELGINNIPIKHEIEFEMIL